MKKIALIAAAAALLASCGAPKAPSAQVKANASETQTNAKLDSQVINGDYSAGRPYQVALLANGRQQFCGGTLIAKDWVLTAAHCLGAPNVSVRVGSKYATRGGEVIRVSRSYRHYSYRNVTTGYDVAVLKLERPFTSRNAEVLSIPSMRTFNSTIRGGTKLTISGWGMTVGNSPYSNSYSLREADLPLVSDAECGRALDVYLARGTICGGVNYKGQTGCHGDSGGPFANRTHVFGIVSWGRANVCNGPTAFTSVAHYADWIERKTGVRAN